MSKKSNAFQRSIHFIQSQLKDSTTIIKESAFLLENNTELKTEREVDVLIEKEINGSIFRIAIECRDRAFKDSIEWIDSLIGKFKNLPVDKIIGVSSSGFSKAAYSKAKANGIELQTIDELTLNDWDNEFLKLGACDLEINFQTRKIIAESECNSKFQVYPDMIVTIDNITGKFSEFFEAFKEKVWEPLLRKKFNEIFLEIYKTKEDLYKIGFIEHRIPLVKAITLSVTDINYKVTALVFIVEISPLVNDLNVKHFKYLNSIISKTLFENQNSGFKYKMYTAQANSHEKVQITIDKI